MIYFIYLRLCHYATYFQWLFVTQLQQTFDGNDTKTSGCWWYWEGLAWIRILTNPDGIQRLRMASWVLTIQTAPGGVQVIPDGSARLLVGPTKNQPLEKIPLKFSWVRPELYKLPQLHLSSAASIPAEYTAKLGANGKQSYLSAKKLHRICFVLCTTITG